MKSHTVNVVHSDIECGEKFSITGRCPIGRAVQRAFRGKKIRVSYKYVSVEDPTLGQYDLYKLPESVTDWQHQYEAGKEVKSIEILLVFVDRPKARAA